MKHTEKNVKVWEAKSHEADYIIILYSKLWNYNEP